MAAPWATDAATCSNRCRCAVVVAMAASSAASSREMVAIPALTPLSSARRMPII